MPHTSTPDRAPSRNPASRQAALVTAMVLSMSGAAPAAAQATAEVSANPILRAAIHAQGGYDALSSIRSIRTVSDGYRNMLEQSERPQGPFIVEFQRETVELDVEHQRWRRKVEASIPPFSSSVSVTVADATAAMRTAGAAPAAPGAAETLAGAREAAALSPARLLLSALEAEDAELGPSTVLQSVFQDVVTFSLDGAMVTLFLNSRTHLPTAVDYGGPLAREGFWRFQADTPMRTYFSSWKVGERGLRLPMQLDVEREGVHEATYMVRSLEIDPKLDEAEMAIPEAIRARFLEGVASPRPVRLGSVAKPAVDLAPGVTLIPGAWNVTIVRQDDGVVILDVPISSAYSELVIAEVARRYPDLPIKAVVSTSDAWPHVAGVRSYVARDIPIYCLDLNEAVIRRVADGRFGTWPDGLGADGTPAHLIPVTPGTVVGSGANRLQLFPAQGDTSERQLIAWFPGLKLLYGSDIFQQGRDGRPSNLQTADELVAAAARERIAPERYFMMHVDVADWAELTAFTQSTSETFPKGPAL